MPAHPNTTAFTSFKGINNVLSPEATPPDFLKRAENIDLDKSGGVSKRKGYRKVDNGDYRCLWSSDRSLGCYGIKNNRLVEILSNYSTRNLSNTNINTKASFEEVDNLVYVISDDFSGIIENKELRNFGIFQNRFAPVLFPTVGTMEAGTYQVAFTGVDANGRESGVGVVSTITLSNNQGITVNTPPIAPSNISYYRVYCSTPNGTTLYYANITLPGISLTISDSRNLISPLKTFGLGAPPTGHIIKYYRGRLYIAQDNVLWYSEPFQYEHWNLANNYFEFPERIREVMPVEDGIWIGSDKLYYLSGEDALTFKRTTKEYVKVVEGTSHRFSGAYLHLDNTPIGYKWLITTDNGIWVLFNQGLNINLTSSFLGIEKASEGSSIFIEDNGMNKYLAILNKSNQPNNAVFGDLIESTIIRNGVVIN